jgi:hypothetical protein
MKMEDGGEPRVHHYFLEKILQLEDDPRLREHMARAQLLNEYHWEWRTWAGLPGWPRPSFSPEDCRKIMNAVADSSPESNPRAYYCQWLVYAIYPQWTSLSTREQERLFYNTRNLVSSYHLTHALLSYCWLKDSDPALARALEVDRLISEVNARLARHQTWDARTADISNERVAFWLHLDNGPPINRRWIERIILSQNPDGGWPFDPKLSRLLQQMVGLSGHDDQSDPHATFLGVYALLKYRELMRQRGTYPPG